MRRLFPRFPVHAALLCAALCVPASPATAACDGGSLATGSQTIDVGGARRTFLVRVSSAYGGRAPAPVVLTFHPFGMNAQYMQARVSVTRTWPEAITVHAEAAAGQGPPSWQTTPGAGNTDLAYVDALLDWLAANACIDPQRVFVVGYSNGAQFAHLLACERRQAFAAVAAAAGRLPCAPAEAAPLVLSHGMGDRTTPYSEAIAAAGAWSAANRCTAPPAAGTRGCAAAAECQAAPVTLCTHPGGHEYDVSFTAQAIAFFRQVGGASR